MRGGGVVGTVGAVRTDRGTARTWRLDGLLAALFVATALATTWKPDPGYDDRDGFAVALILLATAPHVFRRVAPVPVLVVTLSATAALFIRGYDAGALPFLIGVGVYTVGAYRPWREVVGAAVFVNVTLVVMLVANSPRFAVPEFVTSVPIYAATMLVGWTMQSRRLHTESLEREQDQVQLRAAADERLRIAQELHDVIGHSLGVIAVQAGVGMHVMDSDPAEAKKALENISRTSRSSLAEIRRLLGLVRAGEGPASYTPTPGLADLPRLAEDVTGAGLEVDLQVADDARGLPPGVELAAYRIVQEALTNARKHARASRAAVSLDVESGTLRVVVTDNGVPSLSKDTGKRTGGNGLIGMRERVAVYGGSLEAGPVSSWVFRVAATLPFDEVAS